MLTGHGPKLLIRNEDIKMVEKFKNTVKKNYDDSEKEVSYYTRLVKTKRGLIPPEEEPPYSKVFIGKNTSDEPSSIKEETQLELPLQGGAGVKPAPPPRRVYDSYDKVHKTISGIDWTEYSKDIPKLSETEDEVLPHSDRMSVHSKLYENYNNLTKEEVDHVSKYTGPDYYEINRHLYGTLNRSPENSTLSSIEKIKSAISKNRLDAETKVYSGIKINPENLPVFGNVVHMVNPAFTSVSLMHHVAEGFAKRMPILDSSGNHVHQSKDENWGKVRYIPKTNKHIVHIELPEGTHGVYAEKFTHNPKEYEMILHPDAKFKFWYRPNKFINGDSGDESTILHHWYGRLVHDGIQDHPLPKNHFLRGNLD